MKYSASMNVPASRFAEPVGSIFASSISARYFSKALLQLAISDGRRQGVDKMSGKRFGVQAIAQARQAVWGLHVRRRYSSWSRGL